MSAPDQCPRCNGRAFVAAELRGDVRLAVGDRLSPVVARVCTACGYVDLQALRPQDLGADAGESHDVQEYDY
jgi:hypothetical protein